MSIFGKRSGGGRRGDARVIAATPAVFTTVTRSQSILIREISATGARLEGEQIPTEGELLMLQLGQLQAFATVKWVQDNQCGVEFDVPVQDDVIHKLQRVGTGVILSQTYLDQKQAADDWDTGLAR